MVGESEWRTRKQRIDPKLDAAGWRLGGSSAHRSEEEETANGPADYALWLDTNIVGVVEAKKLTVGPQNVLTQAERYARGIAAGPYNFGGLRCPFLYATNGEVGLVPRCASPAEPLPTGLRVPHVGRAP